MDFSFPGVDKQADGRSRIYISSDGMTTGEHNFDLTWSGLPVSQSPGSAIVSSQQAADKVVLTGRGLAAAQTGEQAHFTIGELFWSNIQIFFTQTLLIF